MIDPNIFTSEWLDAWNSHDLEAVLSHYDENFTMSSPLIIQIADIASGSLHGKRQVREYWEAGLKRFPDLRFRHIATFLGANGLGIHYMGPNDRLTVEVFRFNERGLVIDAAAYYGT